MPKTKFRNFKDHPLLNVKVGAVVVVDGVVVVVVVKGTVVVVVVAPILVRTLYNNELPKVTPNISLRLYPPGF